jgi:hypothetical protein
MSMSMWNTLSSILKGRDLLVQVAYYTGENYKFSELFVNVTKNIFTDNLF